MHSWTHRLNLLLDMNDMDNNYNGQRPMPDAILERKLEASR